MMEAIKTDARYTFQERPAAFKEMASMRRQFIFLDLMRWKSIPLRVLANQYGVSTRQIQTDVYFMGLCGRGVEVRFINRRATACLVEEVAECPR